MARLRDFDGGASSRQAVPNPLGFPRSDSMQLVQTEHGSLVHVYDPLTDKILCNSGKNAGRKKADGSQKKGENKFYKSEATQVSCYRCSKLLGIKHDTPQR